MMRSTDECEMSRSCHSATSSSAACRLPRSTRARPQSCSDFIGLRLCGIALEPFCSPSRNASSASRTSVRWRWRISSANDSMRRADRRARVEHFGVAVARQHLRGGHGREAEVLAHVPLDRGIDVGVRADRARELADRDRVARPQQALAVAPHLHRPERELHAERRRLGVDAVRAPDHRRVAELARPRRDRRLELSAAAGRIAIERARHLQRERGVDARRST